MLSVVNLGKGRGYNLFRSKSCLAEATAAANMTDEKEFIISTLRTKVEMLIANVDAVLNRLIACRLIE
jgi:hypothetical protein